MVRSVDVVYSANTDSDTWIEREASNFYFIEVPLCDHPFSSLFPRVLE